MQRQVALLGWPVGHSVSPAMHNAAFAAAGIAARYQALAVPGEQLATVVGNLRGSEWVGANVTIPHKQAVMPYLDEIGPWARMMEAVNTITNRQGRLLGSNTDWAGFLLHLRAQGLDPAGLRTVVLGAGGAARAVAVALAMAGARELTVLNRTAARVDPVLAVAREAAGRKGTPLTVARGPLEGREARRLLANAGLVVNCTPLGMHPDDSGSPLADTLGVLSAGTWVYDTVYRPSETRLMREARSRGLRAVGGLGMLVYQGALSWNFWFGRRGPVDVMWRAAEAALPVPA